MLLYTLCRSLAYNPKDDLVKHALLSLQEADAALISEASPQYVQQLFDDYANTFDDSLQGLGYTAHSTLAAAVSFTCASTYLHTLCVAYT
jgi:predicted TPR repeat methyltransferase